ncbi:MAG: glycosyltransferase [Candidatus Saccharimonas aalborgensis]
MNIAIFTDLYDPHIGGTETSIQMQRRALEAAGHHVVIVTPRYPGRKDTSVIELPSMVVRFQNDLMAIHIPRPGVVKSTAARLKALSIEVIHCQTEFGTGLVGYRVARKLNLPLIYTSHTKLWQQLSMSTLAQRIGTVVMVRGVLGYLGRGCTREIKRRPGEKRSMRALRQLIARFAELATVATAPSGHHAREVMSWSQHLKLTVLYNFVAIKRHQPPLPDLPHFLWIARMQNEKQPLLFVEALRLLHERQPGKFRASMIGSGDLMDRVQLAGRDVPELDIVGQVPYEQIDGYVDTSSIIIGTSFGFDTAGITMVEGFMAARGAVVIDPNLQESVAQEAMLVSDQPTAASLAEVLEQLVRAPAQIEELSNAAKKARDHFFADTAVTRQIELYSKVLKPDFQPLSTPDNRPVAN